MTLLGQPPRRARYSALTRRIVLVNTAVLLILIGGVIELQSLRIGLVDERLTGVETEAQIVASTLAEYATDPDTHTLNVKQAEPLLRQLMAPQQIARAALSDKWHARRGHARPPSRATSCRRVSFRAIDIWSQAKDLVDRAYDNVMGVRPVRQARSLFRGGR
ncbi:MAG: sensor N-terminal transmembrane domain-containing protein [Rhizomicrobium sp.]